MSKRFPIMEAETAAEFVEKFSAAPVREDWTEQLWSESKRIRHVAVQLSEIERDRLVSLLRGEQPSEDKS